MVVMSHAYYERLQSILDLYKKLGEAEVLDASGEQGISHSKMMKKLREKIG
jgi:hypothetical protein